MPYFLLAADSSSKYFTAMATAVDVVRDLQHSNIEEFETSTIGTVDKVPAGQLADHSRRVIPLGTALVCGWTDEKSRTQLPMKFAQVWKWPLDLAAPTSGPECQLYSGILLGQVNKSSDQVRVIACVCDIKKPSGPWNDVKSHGETLSINDFLRRHF